MTCFLIHGLWKELGGWVKGWMNRFFGKVFNCSKIGKKLWKRPQKCKRIAHSSPNATSETPKSKNAEIGTNVVRGVRTMHEHFVYKLCTALIHIKMPKIGKKTLKMCRPPVKYKMKMTLQMHIFPLTRWRHVHAQKHNTWHHQQSDFSIRRRALRNPWRVTSHVTILL